jgi:hypothetical protein
MIGMGRRIEFVAVRDDLLSVLGRVERRVPLAYRLITDSPEPQAWNAADAIKDLGWAIEGTTTSQKRYLVMPATSKFTLEVYTIRSGRTVHSVSPLNNPDSVVFTPAGLYSDWCIVGGEIDIDLPKPTGFDLFGALAQAVRGAFTRVGTCYVGPQAYQLGESGIRLVLGTRAVPESDLKLPKRRKQAKPRVAPDCGGIK